MKSPAQEVTFSVAPDRTPQPIGGSRLRRPPGQVEDWIRSVVAYNDGSGLFVEVTMWTEEEGRSDLSLEISVDSDVVRPKAVIQSLHVL